MRTGHTVGGTHGRRTQADVYVREVVELVRALYPNPLPFGQVVAEAGMAEILDKRVEQLSGGQVQRVKLPLALAGNPEVLVLDEPTVAMDVETRRAFWERIHAAAKAGRTVLFATGHFPPLLDFAVLVGWTVAFPGLGLIAYRRPAVRHS